MPKSATFTAVPEDHNVVGLDVPVDDPRLWAWPSALTIWVMKWGGLPPVQLISLFLHILLQGDPVDQLHHDVLKVGGRLTSYTATILGWDSMATA